MRNWIIAALVAALALSLAAGVVAKTWSEAQPQATVQVRLWEYEEDPALNWISIRTHGADWEPVTPRLLLEKGPTHDGRYRYGDVTIESAVPDPIPTGVHITDTSCYRGRFNAFLTLHGTIQNVTDATINDVTVTAALRDRTGIEVGQGSAVVLHGISPWGKRDFAVNFYSAQGARGTCHVLSVEYSASVRFDEPARSEAGP